MANPFSDLTGTSIAVNYNRTLAPGSQFGTRRLMHYIVEVAGYDWTEESEGDEQFEFPYGNWWSEFLLPNTSFLYPVLRGAQVKGELYEVGWPAVEFDGEDPYTYVVLTMSQDTTMDSEQDWNEYWHTERMEDVIYDSLDAAGFSFWYVNVYPAQMYGREWETGAGSSALAGKNKGISIPEARAERLAAGKVKMSKAGTTKLAKK